MKRAPLAVGTALVNILAATSAMAQSSGEASSGGDIIVTARRTEERLEDVPISITVFNNQQLQNRNVATASDLGTYTPSLSVNSRYGPEKSSFAIRGFNQDQSTAPTVGVYFADVVGVRAQGGTTSGNTVGAGSFTDLQNVQVLKGPQGTLFGRNTTGGAVLLVPQKPTDNFEGYVEGSIGNFDARRVQAAINVPLADTFKVRFSLDRNKRDGYMKNHSGIGPDDYNDLNYFYGRLSVVADLTPDLENYTIAHYSNSNTNSYAMSMSSCDNKPITFPGDPAYQPSKDPTRPAAPTDGLPGFNFQRVVLATAACDQLARQRARGDGVYDVEVSNADPYLKLRTWQVINTTTWRVNDNLTLKNIASYGEFKERTSFSLNSDNLFVPALPFPLQDQLVGVRGQPLQYIVLDVQPHQDNATQNTVTEELQLQGATSNGKLNWVLGGYFEQSSPLGDSAGRTSIFQNCTDAENLVCTQPLGFGIISDSRTRIKFTDKGIFAQGTYNFTQQLALTLGGRWTFDKITGYSEGTRITLVPTGPGTFLQILACNDPRANGGLPPTNNPACRVGTGDSFTSASGVVTSIDTPKSNKPTWLIDLDFKPTPDLLIYGKYARGYRQGGINFTNPFIETWEPEKLDSFEAGAKASFRGAVSGYINVAGFYNNFSNQQIFASLIAKPTSGLSGGAAIVNAGKSRIFGIEVDTSATFFDSLRFDLGYTYLNTKVKKLTAPTLDPDSPFDRILPNATTGDPLPYSPKHKLALTGTYTLPIDESIGRVSASATYVYTSEQLYTTSESALAAQLGIPDPGILGAYNLVNLNLNWDAVAGSPIDLAAFVTNLTNTKYRTAISQGLPTSGFENDAYGAPRMYGMRLRYRFGQ
jgi:iron complex outermembrane receptor protein